MVMISTQPAKNRKVPHFIAHRMDRNACRTHQPTSQAIWLMQRACLKSLLCTMVELAGVAYVMNTNCHMAADWQQNALMRSVRLTWPIKKVNMKFTNLHGNIHVRAPVTWTRLHGCVQLQRKCHCV